MTETVFQLDQYFSHVPMIDNINSNDLQNIRNWIQTKPQLPYITDRQISIFLHSCYGCISQAKITIECYYTLRTETDIFCNRTVSECVNAYRVVYILKLHTLSVDKCHVMYTCINDPSISKWNTYLLVKCLFCTVDIYRNLIPYASGWRFCMNCTDFGFGQFLKLSGNLGLIKKAISYVQDGLPMRLKGIHLLNCNTFICQFVCLVRPLMKKELYDLIHLHPSSDPSIYKYFPENKLPTMDPDDEGEYIPTLIDEMIDLIKKYENWFQDDEYLARLDEKV